MLSALSEKDSEDNFCSEMKQTLHSQGDLKRLVILFEGLLLLQLPSYNERAEGKTKCVVKQRHSKGREDGTVE